MEKRGLSENIDWIIGIGMFLLAIGFIITFFKPGVAQVHSANTLLDILEENFFKEVNWELRKVPVFIEPVKYCIPNLLGGCSQYETHTGDNLIIFLGGKSGNSHDTGSADKIYEQIGNLEPKNIEVFFVKNQEGDSPLFQSDELNSEVIAALGPTEKTPAIFSDIRSSGDDFPKFADDNGNSINFKWDKTKNELYIKGSLRVEKDAGGAITKYVKTKNVILFSADTQPQIINLGAQLETLDKTQSNVVTACIIGVEGVTGSHDTITQEWIFTNNIQKSDNSHCRAAYEVGSVEKLKGMSVVKLANIKEISGGIDAVKNKWGFPQNRNFRITISGKDLAGQSFNEDEISIKKGLVFPETVTIPTNVNVFARRFNDFILNDDGELIPVTVTLQVW